LKSSLGSALLLFGLALAFTSCDRSANNPMEADWPEGTAFAVGEIPISRADLEDVADSLAIVNRVHTRRSLRREALNSQLLPRAAARAIAGDKLELARAEAVAALAILHGQAEGSLPYITSRSGYSTDLGFELWSRARVVELDTWVGPFEGVGNWFVLRVLERSVLEDADIELVQPDANTELKSYYYRVEWAEWGFVPPTWTELDVSATLERVGVVAVQSELKDLIPFEFQKQP